MRFKSSAAILSLIGLMAISVPKTSQAQWVSTTLNCSTTVPNTPGVVDCLANITYRITSPLCSIQTEAFVYWTHANTLTGSVSNTSGEVGAITPVFGVGTQYGMTSSTVFQSRFLLNAKAYIDSIRPLFASRVFYRVGLRTHDFNGNVEFRIDSGGSSSPSEFSIGY